MATVQEVLAANLQHLSPVPTQHVDRTCAECFAPVEGFKRCHSCHRLFSGGAPQELSGVTVPMTIVINPSPWYSRLKGYKAGMAREYRPVVASVAFSYLEEHREHIAGLLGGEPDVVAITPSKGRHGGGAHPLRETLELVQSNRFQFLEPVTYVGAEPSARSEYVPEQFKAERIQVEGRRIILLEDIWVSGRTCISAAGAMLDAGAEAVAILPIARLVHVPHPIVSADHPFFEWIKAPYDLSRWPR